MPIAVIRLSIALIALAFCAASPAQDTFSTLEERMTGEEYMETGLHKLNEEELAALNEWIRERSLTEEEARELNQRRAAGGDDASAAATDRRGLPDSDDDDERPIKSRIVGTYEGWDGDTVFELENGMVWEQAESGTYHVAPKESPAVEIRPGMFGSWQMIVEGQNRRLKVERIK
ncbi:MULTISPECIES: hypothetical protein [unclassified Wenzhouxiangella]|uniref:hypothetical protein n=1 Tax=unclassified Wenzhouxiangella TaxID=2613841 RepID=UPI000E32A568|nr:MULTISPECIES: hypothetical protein [unclassified Wenzhouxiangella]RFF26954.1 hypothetical protein DZK25_10145 [Wenzhouxiangella sp. 15181]RFP69466.1 hypothetical protein DZK26_03635 [Wenzhouxiangella sp. 15190]